MTFILNGWGLTHLPTDEVEEDVRKFVSEVVPLHKVDIDACLIHTITCITCRLVKSLCDFPANPNPSELSTQKLSPT